MTHTSLLQGKTYLVKTFGCQMNLHDSERVAGLLDAHGCIPVRDAQDADIIVFMTCSVREKADTHLYGEAGNVARLAPAPSGRRLVAVGGCIAQRDGARLHEAIGQLDVVFGTSAIAQLPELLEKAYENPGELVVDTQEQNRGFSADLPTHRAQDFHAWVPIMTGCNNFCTYCIVPYVRGREKSRTFERVVEECSQLVSQGVKEITLLGQNVNSYGRDLYGSPRFSELLRAVGNTGISRLRFTSSNPKDLSDDTIRAMAEVPAVMPHLHLALQSGSTKILKAMHRSYTREEYLELAQKIKKQIPGIFLTTDVIVGFPGETEQDFQDTLSLMQEVGFAAAYTFIYSKRPGTPAAKLVDDTPREVVQRRFDDLAHLVDDLAYTANQPFVNTTVTSLVEGTSKKNDHVMVGHSEHNQTVLFDLPQELTAQELKGALCKVKVEEAKTWYLRGTLTSYQK